MSRFNTEDSKQTIFDKQYIQQIMRAFKNKDTTKLQEYDTILKNAANSLEIKLNKNLLQKNKYMGGVSNNQRGEEDICTVCLDGNNEENGEVVHHHPDFGCSMLAHAVCWKNLHTQYMRNRASRHACLICKRQLVYNDDSEVQVPQALNHIVPHRQTIIENEQINNRDNSDSVLVLMYSIMTSLIFIIILVQCYSIYTDTQRQRQVQLQQNIFINLQRERIQELILAFQDISLSLSEILNNIRLQQSGELQRTLEELYENAMELISSNDNLHDEYISLFIGELDGGGKQKRTKKKMRKLKKQKKYNNKSKKHTKRTYKKSTSK